MIILIGCNKGGAGKSTTCTNLAVALLQRSYRVCVVDGDNQRSTARWAAAREEAGTQPLVTVMEKRDNIASALRELDKHYDFVLVDVAGKKSRELVTGMTAADLLLAPHPSSQFDMETLEELDLQVTAARDLNPKLQVRIYQTMASTNKKVTETERQEFLDFVAVYPEFEVMEARSYTRKVYKDAGALAKSVLELRNKDAKADVQALLDEVMSLVNVKEATQ